MSFGSLAFGLERCKVVHEEAMDKDVAAADLAKEDAFGGIVEESGREPGSVTSVCEDEAQGQMLGDVD